MQCCPRPWRSSRGERRRAVLCRWLLRKREPRRLRSRFVTKRPPRTCRQKMVHKSQPPPIPWCWQRSGSKITRALAGSLGRTHHDQQRLLQRGLMLLRKQHASTELQARVGCRSGGNQLPQTFLYRRPCREMVEVFAGAFILGRAPLLDLWFAPVLEPPVVVRDREALIFVGDWVPGRVGRLVNGRILRERTECN